MAMPFIMFTKHVQEYDLSQLVRGLKSAGMDGADLCVRPGYPVTPENVKRMLPVAVKAFADAGMSVPLVTTPGDFTEPKTKAAAALFDACGANGVKLVKLGYWHYQAGTDYGKQVESCRKKLSGFARLAERTGVKAVVHTHSGSTMGLNASAAMQLVQDFDPKDVGVFLDFGHLTIVGEPVHMAIAITKSHLACFALKDLLHVATLHEGRVVHRIRVVRMGSGLVDWPLAIKTVVDMKLEHLPMSIHCEYGGEPPDCVVDLARLDLRFVQRAFAQVTKS
jgi:sugar phosphate isomerase/epimerase